MFVLIRFQNKQSSKNLMLVFVQKDLILLTSVRYSCDSVLQLVDKMDNIGSGRVDTLLLRIAPVTNLKSLCVRSTAILENTSALRLIMLGSQSLKLLTGKLWITCVATYFGIFELKPYCQFEISLLCCGRDVETPPVV